MSRSVALVHDYLLVRRGAERTFEAMADCWPDATIYTLLYDREGTQGRFDARVVETSPAQRIGLNQRSFRRGLPIFPWAVGQLQLAEHDVVISSSSAFAHGVRVAPGARHVCYCHSPFRYAWHERERALAEVPRPLRPALGGGLAAFRRWDRAAARRVDHYVANSKITQRRIAESWGRRAARVSPPVEVERFRPAVSEDFLLSVGELVEHKRVGLALEAARRAKRPIKVVGTGPELRSLRAEYGAVADFLGRVSDAELEELYARALALVVPNVEEFGIAAVEAQAAGRPVVAADGGGAQETVLHGLTGVLVPPDDLGALTRALRDTDFDAFSTNQLVEHASRFSTAAFRERLLGEVEWTLADRG